MNAAEKLIEQARSCLQRGQGQLRSLRARSAIALLERSLFLLTLGERWLPYTNLLRARLAAAGQLGDVLHEQGRPELARQYFEQAFKSAQQIRSQLGDRPDTLRAVSVSLGRLADLERDAGRPEQARPMYEEALKLNQQIRTQLGDRPDTLRDVGISLGRLADLERDAGRPEQARLMHEQALKLNQQIRNQLGDRPDTVRAVSFSLGRLADLERQAGRPERARPMYEEALRLIQQIRTELGDRPDTLQDASVILSRVADLERTAGRPEQARPIYEEALKLRQQVRNQLHDRPDTLRDISISLERLADLERDAGHPEQARPMYEEALKLRQKNRTQLGDRPDTLRDVSVGLERLANLEHDAGDPEQARPVYEEALKLRQQVRNQLGDRPDALRGVGNILGRLADLAVRAQEWPAAADHALQAADLTIQSASSRQELPILDMRSRSFQLASISRAHPPARDQAWPLYGRMVSKVNAYTEFNDPESTVRSRPAINQFHSIWLALALDTAIHRIPSALGASQGRKVSALVMHELQRQASSASAAPELQALLHERERINHLALALGGGAFAGRSAFGDVADMIAPKRAEVPADVSRARTEALWAEHRQALEAYEAARAALIASDPDFAELQPDPERFELKRLQQGLTEDSALLLLVQQPADGTSRAGLAHAMLIRASGEPVLRLLPELAALSTQLQTLRLMHTMPKRGASLAYRDCQGSAWRSGPQGETEGLDPDSVPLDVHQALRERLWVALQGEGEADLLAGLRQLHVVSHGDLHGLPLALGAREGLTVSLYPGLVYYWLQRQRGALVWPATRQLLYQFYSPEDDLSGTADSAHALAPIPHVETEAALVGSCWAERDELLRRGRNDADGSAPTVLHLACHGTLEREGQEDPCLILADEHRLNLIELLQGSPSAPIVYLSACMVGRTREDLDGDPLGLVGGFMLRGARCVIAALNPISDFYAPLLAFLFHRCLQAQAQAGQPLDAVGALAQAKEQLRSGDWGNGEEQAQQAVIEAYAPRLQQQLEQAIRDAGSNALVPADWWQAQLQGWLGGLIPALGIDIFNLSLELAQLLEAKLIRSEAATTDVSAGQIVAEQFVAARAKLYSSTPAVQHLLLDVQAFG